MDKVSASFAKQNFSQVLELGNSAPVGIERHGRLVAAIVPCAWLDRVVDERRLARQEQEGIEQKRLLAHQRIGIALLGRKDRRKELLAAARSEVRRWAAQDLCSPDYIDRWTQWLALPDVELVELMCSDADGWGRAMRQNSPFAAGPP
jgi:antitoxin (DNA-binding transcriptional repressor) of toxin-antitoxin stability system